LGYLDEVMQSDGIGNAELSSICGRYYAMDRDKRWQRTQLAYNLLVNVEGEQFKSYQDAMQASYLNGVTDEFIKPISLNGEGIKEGDIVLSFNFRTDRGRQISQALTQQDFPEFNMSKIDINYFTMTEYDKTYTDVNVLFDNADLENTLGEILSNNKIPQLRAAETEKYPHVTFFFNGGREEPFDLEERIMANSPKVATYDLQPEMSALELTAKVKEQLITEKFGFVCVNYANPDMVGHTGVFSAIMKACETVDSCSKELVDTATQHGYTTIVIADHGNADKALNEDGSPNTAHSTNLVPVYLVNGRGAGINSGKLADVAPSILELLEIEKPAQMDGKSLIIK
jgi:2,3-bisphosphoglycerate-independent phosphoglycerate mutase